jgi:CubicO group peptidase (beta-lactamase class C family)
MPSRNSFRSLTTAGRRSFLILNALILAACGGGGGGGDDDSPPPSSNPPPVTNPPPAGNSAPVAQAGTDKSATFPEPVPLQGAATDADAGATLTYKWTGPAEVTFDSDTAASTQARFSQPGRYDLTLTASDGTATGTDTVQVVVDPARYPTAGWVAATPAEVQLDETKLALAKTHATSVDRGDAGGAGVIIRYGKLAYSWGNTAQRYDLKSTTKSIGGLTLLLALANDSIQLEDFAAPKVPGFATPPTPNPVDPVNAAWPGEITILNLATHTAGFEKADDPFDSQTLIDPSNGELLSKPGTVWRYSDAGLNWLADALTLTFNDDLYDVLAENVLGKVGIAGSAAPASPATGGLHWRRTISRDPLLNGIERRELASGISASVDAMARIGYLMLRKGNWSGEQVLPEDVVALAHQPALAPTVPIDEEPRFPLASTNYGVLWWTNTSGSASLPGVPTDAYWSWGLGESLIVVIPSRDLVIARAGVPHNGTAVPQRLWNTGWDGNYEVLRNFLVPILEGTTP